MTRLRSPDQGRASAGQAPAGSPDQARASVGQFVIATLVILTACLIATWPLGRHLSTHVTGHWDSFFGMWRLAWIADAVRSSDLQLFNAPIFHPQPLALALSDAIVFPGVAAAPLRYAGIEPTLVYNVVLFAAMASSGLAMFLLVHSQTGRSEAALVAAVVYAIAPYRMDHLDHLEMQMAVWMPLTLWSWHRTVDTGRVRTAVASVGCMALQWLSCIYYGLLFVPVFLAAMMVEWWSIARERRRSIAIGLAIAGVGGAIVIAAYTRPYAISRAETGDRRSGDISRYSATIESYIAVSDHNALYGPWLSRFGAGETRLFPGALAAVLAAVGTAVGPWNRRRFAYLVAGLVAFDLSLGTNGILFPLLREWTIPYRGLRAPARAGIIVLLVVAVLAGAGVNWVAARLGRRAAPLCAALAVLILVLEYRHPPDLWEAPPPAQVPELGFARGSVVVDLPMAKPERLDRSQDAYFMTQRIGQWPSMINGYSGYYPDHYVLFAERIREFPDDRAIREMARVGVNVLAVHERWYGPRFSAIVGALNSRADVERIGEYYAGDKRVAVFQVLKP